VKIAVLLLLARDAQWPEALDWLAKDCVGNRFGSQIVWNRSTRRAGERGERIVEARSPYIGIARFSPQDGLLSCCAG